MTRFNNKYPYTDFHELNADWLLETVKDAEAEAKEAADTVATYNDRLTTVEGDLAPIKAAMPGLASDVSGLRHDVGIMDSLITNTINPGLSTLQTEVETPSTGLLDRMTAAEGSISTLKNEVETPSTGLLDRVTALENAPAPSANAVYYLEFDSSLVSIDPDNAYDSRIKYDWLKQFVPLNVSGEDTHVIKLYDSHTQKVYDLAAFHLQESVSPDGKFVFTNRAEHTTGGVVDYYVNSTVTVLQNGSNPTFAEEKEIVLPAVTSGDAGDVLTVDNNGDWVAAAAGTITYSTTEHVVGIWTDNKPVYEQIITTPMPSTPYTSFLFSHNIANIDNIIEYKAFIIFPNGTVHTFNDIQLDNGGIYSPAVSFLGVDKTNITIMCGIDRSTCSGRIFLRYTKTTD